MSKRDKDLEEEIRKAAEEGRIEFAESDVMAEYEEIADDFFRLILGIEYGECFVSDESTLSDFAGCIIESGHVSSRQEVEDKYEAARQKMVKSIKENYGILVDTHDYLITVFEKIKRNQNYTIN